eukprot:scaffold49826_cov21-Tisochrysis_lutea.AAC.2
MALNDLPGIKLSKVLGGSAFILAFFAMLSPVPPLCSKHNAQMLFMFCGELIAVTSTAQLMALALPATIPCLPGSPLPQLKHPRPLHNQLMAQLKRAREAVPSDAGAYTAGGAEEGWQDGAIAGGEVGVEEWQQQRGRVGNVGQRQQRADNIGKERRRGG